MRLVRSFALSLLFVAPAVGAQRPIGADTLSPTAVAESLKVLTKLRRDVAKDKNNAALWYRRGMIAWALYDRDRTNDGLRNLDWTRLGREADSSIRLAAAIEPKNARYRITQGQYYLSTGWIPVRVQAYHVFDLAIAAARASGDKRLIAEAAIEKGRVHWRRYDPSDFGFVPADVRQRARMLALDSADRGNDVLARDIDTVDAENPITKESLRAGRRLLMQEFRRSDGGFTHETDYIKADEFFREAYEADPTYARAYQQMAMLLAERMRWTELGALARARLARETGNAWAWMTLGLAAHRLGDQKLALAAFDSGLRHMGTAERKRLDNIGRLTRPSDSASVAGWSDARRADFEHAYWDWSAPLWSREETRPRAEFLARVAYAEIRWTVDELRKRGADSDRGVVYIRYGPPDARAAERTVETWWYDYARLSFTFIGMPTFGTAYFADADYALDVLDSVPSRWDNVVRGRVDTLPVRIARFRAGPDSADVVFSSFPPVAAIQRNASLGGPIRTDFWLFNTNVESPPAHDSGGTTANNPRSFTKRLALGNFMYRFEATGDGSLYAAVARSPMSVRADSTGFAADGFGMSDILLASRAAPIRTGRRWSDFDFEPSVGTLSQGASLALVWENYELGQRDGSAQYEIKLTLERKYQQFLNKVRARVISAWAALMGTEQTADRLIFRYERTVAHSPILADYVTLALEDTPAGNYDLTLDITDRVTGLMTSRTIRVVIRE